MGIYLTSYCESLDNFKVYSEGSYITMHAERVSVASITSDEE